ncbi:MAG: nicotinate (nicotinamide) nucleotide adenylyltransferase [Candidatus Krumholzibacteria bacterium]|nr:nicotinate (nicotinamide) nucleotide adenylyltransferase [Candidatus Krumholzibacteria bacterium]
MIRAFLGGSFDPVHEGHVAMARHVLSKGLADMVHVVPAWLSPHKNQAAASVAHRLAMVRLAFPESPDLQIDTWEIDRGRSCYTVDTMRALQKSHAGDDWVLVIGADNLANFDRWHRPEALQRLAKIAVLGRDGHETSLAVVQAKGLLAERVLSEPGFDQPVSSTAVRAMLRAGPASAKQLVAGGIPAAVARYIVTHKLYFPDQNGETRVPDPD